MTFPAWTIAPFVLMLAAIAIAPLVPSLSKLWDRPRNQLLYALVLGVPVAIGVLAVGEWHLVVDALVEYGQFIALLLSLFIVSGGFFLRGDIAATPRTNAIFLAIGGVLASFIGTTGAAMLLIRPLLNTNAERKHKAHTVVFAIFIVANCGGLLTPLGDPPLFLGMLRGVPFTWTFHLFPMWLFVNVMLLLTYWALDRRIIAHETPEDVLADRENITPLKLAGASNFVWFAVIIAAVALIPSIDAEEIVSGHAAWSGYVPWREIVMIGAALCSLRFGDRRVRYQDNEFEMGPIQEVAALFIGIFLTMIPALAVLRAAAPSLHLNEITLFVFTGGLSSVLDNAPTYATFFEMASQLPGEPRVADVPELYLVAISLGAVLCGAMTYIGNGPNFMVKSVAESAGVKMPSFGGYVQRAVMYLAPTLIAMMLLFIAQPWWLKAIGALLSLLMLIRITVLVVRTDGVPGRALARLDGLDPDVRGTRPAMPSGGSSRRPGGAFDSPPRPEER
ncbi:sodium:proton antiporter [Brachybacterium endophyticum]|uniref:Sodium:proton antiporter n=1 Tax=Brachybacterium endophyticum TaxID=2182385 RepID=A0A2U2RJR4_9MICO|nr:sodium:proton antiporter [Brachybacterium endophyticum]PWH06086.1 sodium:proton antiporter [Brachybacterium endophyticum]